MTYVRPGPRPLVGVDAIMDQYVDDWRTYDVTIEIRRIIEADDTVAVELTLTSGDGKREVEAIVIHRWADERMIGYRLYLDPVPGLDDSPRAKPRYSSTVVTDPFAP